LAWLSVSLRRLRDERLAAVGLALVVFVTAFAFGIAPRLLEQLANAGLHTELASAPAVERSIAIHEVKKSPTLLFKTLPEADAAGAQLQTTFGAATNGIITGQTVVAETPLWDVLSGPTLKTAVALRMAENAFDHVTFVDGRAPTGRTLVIPDPRPGALPTDHAVTYEVAVNQDAATESGISLGQTLPLSASQIDSANVGVNLGAVAKVVGIYRANDPNDSFWQEDGDVLAWHLALPGTNNETVVTTALVSPDAYSVLVANTEALGMPVRYQWRYAVDASRINAGNLGPLVTNLRHLDAVVPNTGSDIPVGGSTLRSGLLRLLLQHQATWSSASTLLGILGTGAIAIAIASLAGFVVLASGRRRAVASLERARGASGIQLSIAAVVEAALLSLPAALAGGAIAAALVPSSDQVETGLAIVGVWLITTMLIVAMVRPLSDSAAEPGRGSRVLRAATPRQLVAEAFIVAGALAATLLLRQRGINATGASNDPVGADPLIAIVPALAGLAAGVAILRLHPYPARLFGWVAARRAGLVPSLASRRLTRGGSSAPVLLVLVAAATTGAFGAATLGYLERGADVAAWQSIGGPARIEGVGLLPTGLASALPAGTTVALASESRGDIGGGSGTILAVDADAYRSLLAGSPIADALPPSLSGSLGSPADALPAVVAADRQVGVSTGQTFTATLFGRPLSVKAVAVRDSFPGLGAGPFLVISRQQLTDSGWAELPAPTLAYASAPPGGDVTLQAAVNAAGSNLGVTFEGQVAAQERSSPVIGAIIAGAFAAVAVALAYALLAVASSLALAAAGRRPEQAHLTVIGLSRRQAVSLVFAEYTPSALIAYLIGVVLGLVLFAFLQPSMGLGPLLGVSIPVPLLIEPGLLAALLAAILAIVLVGGLIGSVVQRERDVARSIRRGIS
jgi:putative ABC transport system permease protein